jgi:hypothetical protein
MRFEIGPGGGFVVLVGLLGLSAAVFFLGMISGREMAQTEQSQAQLASVYQAPAAAPASDSAAPAQNQPAPAPASAPAAPPPAPLAATTPQPPSQAAIASTAPPPTAEAKPRYRAPMRRTVASAPPRHAFSADGNTSADSSADEADTATDERPAASRSAGYGGHHHGYNIVIDAAMDRASASRMYSRLLGLGYTSRIVPTQINGQTWYKVQVGPYPSAEDARAAQDQLRAAYTARFINHASTSSAAAASRADTDPSSGSDDSAPSD